jgi:hypothetical protein
MIQVLSKERLKEMARINYKIGFDNVRGFVFVKIIPVIKEEEVVYFMERNSLKERPVRFFTGTTDMKDWIGNVRKITKKENTGEIFLEVEGVYRGKNQTLKNIKSKDPNIKKIGDRVMVTEHLNVAGGFDMLATKRRILDLVQSDMNFINIGWSTDEQCRYLRIDPYTGETNECVGSPVF